MNLDANVRVCDFLKVRVRKDGAVMVKKNADGTEKWVKFDCVPGNPPYQANSGDTSDVAIYPAFVEKARSLNPEYMSMVIPMKWMMGDGKGTAEFRKNMIACKTISKIVATKNSR
jgi:hypothetical protein